MSQRQASHMRPTASSTNKIETVARRFLHDFTSETSKNVLHDADQAAWWACSLRGEKQNQQQQQDVPATAAAAASFVDPVSDVDNNIINSNNNNNSKRKPLSTFTGVNNNPSSVVGGNSSGYAQKSNQRKGIISSVAAATTTTTTPAAIVSSPKRRTHTTSPSFSSSPIRDQRQQQQQRRATSSPQQQQQQQQEHQELQGYNHHLQHHHQGGRNAQLVKKQVHRAGAGAVGAQETKARASQLAAFAHTGCASKLNPMLGPKCTGGQRRWDPDTRGVISQSDPLYALLHRRLEEEGFTEDFTAAEEKFRQRLARSQAAQRAQESDRRDKELQWYLDVYRPKQKREGLIEVEGDSRLEISEEEMASRMKIKQKFLSLQRSASLKARRREQEEDAQIIEIARQREAEMRHLREWLATGQNVILEEEFRHRRHITKEADHVFDNLFNTAQAQLEHMLRVRLLLVNRLRSDLGQLKSSEENRRNSILAMEATARRQFLQSFLTARAESFQKQRSEAQLETSRARKEIAREENEERNLLFRVFSESRFCIQSFDILQHDEQVKRYRVLHLEEEDELRQLYTAFRREEQGAVEVQLRNERALLEDAANTAKHIIVSDAQRFFDQVGREFFGLMNRILEASVMEVIAAELYSRNAIQSEYHQFLVHGARSQAGLVDFFSVESQRRHNIVQEEHSHLRELVRASLLTSIQVREAAERYGISRSEHQSASRLIVEATILRDAVAAARKSEFIHKRNAIEKKEYESRQKVQNEKLDILTRLVTDCRLRLAEMQKSQDAKLIQQALRLQTNFVGVGLAERPKNGNPLFANNNNNNSSSTSNNNNTSSSSSSSFSSFANTSSASGGNFSQNNNNNSKLMNNNNNDAEEFFLQVESLVFDGPGMRAGLRLGDMVLSIGGIPVSTTLEMRSALKRSGFVSKEIDIVVRRFIPNFPIQFVQMNSAPVQPTIRPEGSFEEKIEKLYVLVSTTDEKFKTMPFWFDPKKTTRRCLPLIS